MTSRSMPHRGFTPALPCLLVLLLTWSEYSIAQPEAAPAADRPSTPQQPSQRHNARARSTRAEAAPEDERQLAAAGDDGASPRDASPPLSADATTRGATQPDGQGPFDEAARPAEVTASRSTASTDTTGMPPAAPTSGEGDDDDDDDDLEYEVGARIMMGWEYEVEHAPNEPADTKHGFFLKQARFKFDARFRKRMRAQVDVEFGDALDDSLDLHEIPYLRDAWLEYRTGSEFELRVGSFKRPFTRIEDVGAGSLPLSGRGLGNSLIVESMNYGERSLGAQIGGKVKPIGLDWKLMASKPGYHVDGVNLNARLEYDLLDWVELGVNYVHQRREDVSDPDGDIIGGHGFGGDVRLDPGGLYLVVDAYMADDLRFGRQPSETIVEQLGREFRAAAVSSYASYDFPISKHYVLQPVVFVEWADRSLEYSGSEGMRYLFGFNALWREEYLRVMPQVEIVRPGGDIARALWDQKETYYLLLSGQL